MKGDIKNLVKNVLEENIVKFKDQTSNILYSKLTNRLKQEYVNVSKRMFKNINEAASPEAFAAAEGGPAVPPGEQTPSRPRTPNITYGAPPPAENPGPAPKKPIRGDNETPAEYERRLNAYYESYNKWLEQYKAWQKYRAWQQGQGRKPGAPGYTPSRG